MLQTESMISSYDDFVEEKFVAVLNSLTCCRGLLPDLSARTLGCFFFVLRAMNCTTLEASLVLHLLVHTKKRDSRSKGERIRARACQKI